MTPYRETVTRTVYRYELRRGNEIISTGHLTRDEQLAVGDAVAIGGHEGSVRSIEPLMGERELRLVVRVAPAEPKA